MERINGIKFIHNTIPDLQPELKELHKAGDQIILQVLIYNIISKTVNL